MAGNQIRSTGGWEVQEGSEMRWVGSGMSGAVRELDSPRMYSFPGIPTYTWGLIGVTLSITFTFLILTFAVRKAGAQLKTLLAAGGASFNSEGFGSRADNTGCCRPWGAWRGSGPPPELCEPTNLLVNGF